MATPSSSSSSSSLSLIDPVFDIWDINNIKKRTDIRSGSSSCAQCMYDFDNISHKEDQKIICPKCSSDKYILDYLSILSLFREVTNTTVYGVTIKKIHDLQMVLLYRYRFCESIEKPSSMQLAKFPCLIHCYNIWGGILIHSIACDGIREQLAKCVTVAKLLMVNERTSETGEMIDGIFSSFEDSKDSITASLKILSAVKIQAKEFLLKTSYVDNETKEGKTESMPPIELKPKDLSVSLLRKKSSSVERGFCAKCDVTDQFDFKEAEIKCTQCSKDIIVPLAAVQEIHDTNFFPVFFTMGSVELPFSKGTMETSNWYDLCSLINIVNLFGTNDLFPGKSELCAVEVLYTNFLCHCNAINDLLHFISEDQLNIDMFSEEAEEKDLAEQHNPDNIKEFAMTVNDVVDKFIQQGESLHHNLEMILNTLHWLRSYICR